MKIANCKSRSEYLEKAALFYTGYVSDQDATARLPPALAAGMEIPDEQLKALRDRRVQNVKKTSGSVTLDDAVRYLRGGL